MNTSHNRRILVLLVILVCSIPYASRGAPVPGAWGSARESADAEKQTASTTGSLTGTPSRPAADASGPAEATEDTTDDATTGVATATGDASGSGARKPLDEAGLAAEFLVLQDDDVVPIYEGERLLARYHDFDGDGDTDLFVLTAEAITDEAEPRLEIENLRDPIALYRRDRSPYRFVIRGFLQDAGSLVSLGGSEVGVYQVLDGFTLIPITEGLNSPIAVSVEFITSQGRVEEWVVFTDAGVSRLTLRERMGSAASVTDIDDDGVIDVVLSNESFEAGVGYETYLSWLKWSGTRFELYRTTNVVRSLTQFLDTAFDTLKRGERSEFLSRFGPSSKTGRNPEEAVFGELFTLVPSPGNFRNTPLPEDAEIARIIHTEILENPFSQQDENGRFFPLPIRIETTEGSVHLYTVRVYMALNPFLERQYYFLPIAQP